MPSPPGTPRKGFGVPRQGVGLMPQCSAQRGYNKYMLPYKLPVIPLNEGQPALRATPEKTYNAVWANALTHVRVNAIAEKAYQICPLILLYLVLVLYL